MTTALSGARLSIREPRSREVRVGEEFQVVVDVEVPDPWFEVPALGKKISSIDGNSGPGLLTFETEGPVAVPALGAGDVVARDTRLDVHTPSGFPDAGAGRGVEAALRVGAVEIRYGHLQRGSTRSGPVRSGDTIGRAGNTGRCADGCGRSFVTIEVSGGREARTIDELAEPIAVTMSLDGKDVGSATLPQGELKVQGLRVGRTRAPKSRSGAKTIRLEVVVSRGRRTIASESADIALRI